MDAEEKYLFDLMGFLVVKQVLSREEVGELNTLIDSYELWRKAESGQESAWINDPNFMTVGALHTWDEPFRPTRAPEDDGVSQDARRPEVPSRPRPRTARCVRAPSNSDCTAVTSRGTRPRNTGTAMARC